MSNSKFEAQIKARQLPFYLLFTLIVFTSLLTAYLGMTSYSSSKTFSEIRAKTLRIQDLQEEILRLDEALKLTAEMATATGEKSWEYRYKEILPRFEDALSTFSQLSPGVVFSEKMKQTKRDLIEIWDRCFELVRNNKQKEAAKLVNGERYENLNTVYADEISELNRLVHLSAEEEKNHYELKLRLSALASFLALLVTLVGWIFVFHSLRKWSQEILDLNIQLQSEVAQKASLLVETARIYKLGEIAGGISHEINNPVAVILGKSSTLKRQIESGSIDPQKMVQDLAKIDNNANRISKIVKRLRAFSRGPEDDVQTTLVGQGIEETLELCRSRLQNHAIEFRLNLNVEPDTIVPMRPLQFSQVLLNLLGNAFDAVDKLDVKWIELDASVSAETLTISVMDSGLGIPPNLQNKIMQPFFSTKEPGKRTGLSLSISKDIVERCHGKLVYDKNSKNTRFLIEIPYTKAQEVKAA